MSNRVSSQYHLTLHTQPTYQGLPLENCKGGFIGEYLERLRCTINRAVQASSKVFAVRVDLRFPQYYNPWGEEALSNEHLHVYIKTLRGKFRRRKNRMQKAGQRTHDMVFEYVWAREYGPMSNRPHYHLLLLFNGHAFNTLGHFSNEHESLFNYIGESWGAALGIHVAEGRKFTHFPEAGQYWIASRSSDQVAMVFRRASYLAKVASKNFHDGYHVFGASRGLLGDYAPELGYSDI